MALVINVVASSVIVVGRRVFPSVALSLRIRVIQRTPVEVDLEGRHANVGAVGRASHRNQSVPFLGVGDVIHFLIP